MLFIASTLAAWRVSHLITAEDGPFNMVARLRAAAGSGFFGDLMDCFYCTSMWVALPLAYWVGHGWPERIIAWLAVSGGAILLERLIPDRSQNQDTIL
ncbi:MAG: DUF1360 domain-containing protein [Phycisphaerae bacterium]|nr:DUF1360 domain-containing protein [Gemmatimonadaceae bacterium]